jgi:hypothetical protein
MPEEKPRPTLADKIKASNLPYSTYKNVGSKTVSVRLDNFPSTPSRSEWVMIDPGQEKIVPDRDCLPVHLDMGLVKVKE